MGRKELSTELKNFEQIRNYIEELLGHRSIDERTKVETLLVFEALYNDMLRQGIPEDTVVHVWCIRLFGDLRIKIGFEGNMYVPASGISDETAADDRIITAFADKIESRYHGGHNNLILTAHRSSFKHAKLNLIALILAVIVYFLLAKLTRGSEQQDRIGDIIFYVEKLFTDAIISIGAPVTFFSLLRNLTGMFIAAEGNSRMRKIELNAILTSIVAVVMGIFMSVLLSLPYANIYLTVALAVGGEGPMDLDLSVKEKATHIIESLVHPSVFGSFESFSPFPLIFLAILTTYALCSSGSYYEGIRKVIDGFYVLFSKMLSAVMYTLPFFCFMAVLDVLYIEGFPIVMFLVGLIILVPVSLIAMGVFESARLMAAGVKLGAFVKKLVPLILENLKINSTIDAVPFNTRYCVTQFGIDRKLLDESLPALASVNLNGNCFIITFIAIMFVQFNDLSVTSWGDIAIIGIVVFFLSLGAPNQPGSILIGMLVILSYVQATWAISVAICCEALFGGYLSMTNAVGDIVTVMVTNEREIKEKEKKQRD